MIVVLYLLLLQGMIGAFDTFYYHEWKARLPARGIAVQSELFLHAVRDYLYAVIFCTIPWIAWRGGWCLALIVVLIAEIVFTMWDFLVEAIARKPLGDVYPGERVTHALMGIIYGAMIACLIPVLIHWWALPTAFVVSPPDAPLWLRGILTLMGLGVFVSGLRDLYAAFGLPGGSWPWPPIKTEDASGDLSRSTATHHTDREETVSTR